MKIANPLQSQIASVNQNQKIDIRYNFTNRAQILCNHRQKIREKVTILWQCNKSLVRILETLSVTVQKIQAGVQYHVRHT